MRTAAELLQDLKDSSLKIRDHYASQAAEYEKYAREMRELAAHQQQVIDDCERGLVLLRN